MNALNDDVAPAAFLGSTAEPGPAPQSVRAIPIRPKRLLGALGGGLLVLGVAATGAWWFTEGRYIESTDNAYVQGDIAVLGARIEGDVAAINVADNQPVHAGDALVSLDARDWAARLDQARAAAAEAAAAVITARRQVDQQGANLAAADAAITQAEAEQVRASADAARSDTLTANGWTSRQANDRALADSRKANAILTSVQAQKRAAEQTLAVLQAEVVQAEARRQSADAAVRLAESNLDNTVIRAPFDGIVGNRSAQLGQHVQPGTQLLAVTPRAAQLFVVANFKETQLAHMRPGMRVRLVPDIDSSKVVEGRVNSLAPATGALFSLLPPENATGNFTKVVQRIPVKITVDARQAAQASWLRAGLSVTAEVDTRGPDAMRSGLFGAAAATVAGVFH